MTLPFKGHRPVLLEEVLQWLQNPLNGDETERLFADLTFGGGGHSFEIIKRNPNARILGFDQDADAIKNALKKISEFNLDKNISLVHCNFESFTSKISSFINEQKFDGILADLGISSHQIDSAERGMSFRFDSPLDMRMNSEDMRFPSAADIVNNESLEELKRIFSDFGEERYSNRIAQRICERREEARIETTKQLEDIIFHCYPKKERFSKTHPATRVFQALRIAVNRELEVLEKVLPDLLQGLKNGGRLVVISFHSLEDRIVKQTFKLWHSQGHGTILTKRPITASAEELMENPRARSAKLRVFERRMNDHGGEKI